MPANKDAMSRFKLIDARLNMKQKPSPTLEELVNFVSEKLGKQVSVSSIQKDIKAMRYDESLGYMAPIEYDRFKRAYRYTEEGYSIDNMPVTESDLEGLEMAIGILSQFKDIPAIKVFEDAILKISQAIQTKRETLGVTSVIQLDRPDKYKGIDYIIPLVNAIKAHEVVRLEYQSFKSEKPKVHKVHPYFVKEFDNRLYLIGNLLHPQRGQKMLTFAFDRIVDATPMAQYFTPKTFDQDLYFKNALGVSMLDMPAERVVLSFTPQVGRYLKTQPLHSSQKILKDNNQECQIELELVVNYELQMRILSYGADVQVLEPTGLREHMRSVAASMSAMYV
jgi:predicted DNA-binding transcriptional regulator YafY